MNLPPVWGLFGAALLIFLLGLGIHITQRIELLNMIDAKRVSDRAGLARLAARFLYAMAATLLGAALLATRYGPREGIVFGTIAIVVVLSIWLTVVAQRYVASRP